jgi:hypothetical protein
MLVKVYLGDDEFLLRIGETIGFSGDVTRKHQHRKRNR